MIAPCYQCPAVFDTQAERALHVLHQHGQSPATVAVPVGHGKGKIQAQFLRHATPEQHRRFNELAGYDHMSDAFTCG